MPDKRTHAGALDATTGETYAPPLTEGHEMPHIEDRIADGHMTKRARTVAICAAILSANAQIGGTWAELTDIAIDLMGRAEEWDRHERLRYPKPAPEPLPPQLPAYRK